MAEELKTNPRASNVVKAKNGKGQTTTFNISVWKRLKVGNDGSRNGWFLADDDGKVVVGEKPIPPTKGAIPAELKVINPLTEIEKEKEKASAQAAMEEKINSAVSSALAEQQGVHESEISAIRKETSAAMDQVDKLTNHLLDNDHLPEEKETAADLAIRLLNEYKSQVSDLVASKAELVSQLDIAEKAAASSGPAQDAKTEEKTA